MLDTLFAGVAPLDGWVSTAIIAKALGYGAALLAMGGPLFLLALPQAGADTRRFARRLTAAAALVAAGIMLLRLDIRAGRISGMGLEGMLDPVMIGIVWDSPMGDAIAWRAIGLALVAAVLMRSRAALVVAALGSLLVAVSYAQIGHSLGSPRAVLAGLLVVHLLCVAFWVAALAPLYRGTRQPGAVVLHRFGRIAAVAVGALVLAGAVFAYLMTGGPAGLFGSAYGWTLLIKLALVAALLALAAWNKLRLVPAITRGEAGAGAALRRSIAWEGTVIALILLATAALTSVTTPPVNL